MVLVSKECLNARAVAGFVRWQSMKPKRIQRKRVKGWKMPANTIYVGRPSIWGNPYRVAVSPFIASSHQDAVNKHFRWVIRDEVYQEKIKNRLKGKNLACWCPLDQPCHADILLEIAND